MRHMKLFALIVLLPACLGGEGKVEPDAAATPDAATTDGPATDGPVPLSACVEAMQDAPDVAGGLPYADALATATLNTWDGTTIPAADEPDYPGGKYRTLTADAEGNGHPGCSTAGLEYTPANIPGYPCAAKEYPFPDGVAEDTGKPIVILIHGNSDSPEGWEAHVHLDPGSITDFPADTEARPQLAERLPALGYRTIAVDMRIGLVDDPPNFPGGNPARNIDHGWGVPIAQELIKQVIINNPDRKISIIGFSLGATVARDALRRLWIEWREDLWDINAFSHVKDVILASGAHHGVSTYGLPDFCGQNLTMKGLAACQLGQRNQYTQIEFHRPLSGPAVPAELTQAGEFGGWYETPCADGDYAFGTRGACAGGQVEYTTITMKDLEENSQQDEFVSEHSSRVYPQVCADNHVTQLSDFDTSAYFINGYFRNHYGSIRSEAGLAKIINVLGD
jgi:pimeloyl-ACP methyl ester carboxylesterase